MEQNITPDLGEEVISKLEELNEKLNKVLKKNGNSDRKN